MSAPFHSLLSSLAEVLLFVCLLVTEEILSLNANELWLTTAIVYVDMDNTTQYHGRHPIKGVMPSAMLLVFLTPR